MPEKPTFPGIYIEEVPSGVRTVMGASTSIAAFVGRARKGPICEAVQVHSWGEFVARFGDLWNESKMTWAVQDFFVNGGSDALIVRVYEAGVATTESSSPPRASASTGADAAVTPEAFLAPFVGCARAKVAEGLYAVATSPGAWGNELLVSVVTETITEGDHRVPVYEIRVDDGGSYVESLRGLRVVEGEKTAALARVERELGLVRLVGDVSALLRLPSAHEKAELEGGADGVPPLGQAMVDLFSDTGPLATPAFNLLCIPPYGKRVDAEDDDVEPAVWTAALALCVARRAVLLVDPQSGWMSHEKAKAGGESLVTNEQNAALFFPHLRRKLPNGRTVRFVPSGAVAGVFARTDSTRGVWKAPAGLDANLRGLSGLSVDLTEGQIGGLNQLGINCLRRVPAAGYVVWGSRTRKGDDRLASEWKYIPVRRTALYIEESLYQALHWVVFEPNDESLWAQIRLNVGTFLHDMFRQGAFQGTSPRAAYFVKCDAETTLQSDINRGMVNIFIGFAPLKPAEFVILKLQQIARGSAA